MRCFSSWVTLCVVALSSTIASAQIQATSVAYNTSIPSPVGAEGTVGAGAANAIGSGVNTTTSLISGHAAGSPAHAETIPLQGSVDMGVNYSQPVYGNAATSVLGAASDCNSCNNHYSAPCASGACGVGTCATGACGTGHRAHGCNHCGLTSCLGSCRLGSLASRLGAGNNSGWFGGLYYLNLRRDDDNLGRALATSDTTGNVILGSGMSRMPDADGFGVRIGKMLSPCCAVEAIYWQVFPDDYTASAGNSFLGYTSTSTLLFNDLDYGGAPVADYYTNSQLLTVTRTFDYRNLEVNFLRLPYSFGGGGCGRLALLAGARYFRADETFDFFADDANEVRGDDPTNEVYYFNDVENHLVGFQVGGLYNYQFSNKWSCQLGSKVGIYNNHMTKVQEVTGGLGGATISAGPDAGQPYAVRVSKDDVAFLGEFDAGVSYCVNSNWRLTGGYKVLAISGFADAAGQAPYNFNSLSQAGLINDNGSLILHGFYAGAEFAW